MPQIKFEYNIKRDAYNWIRQVIFLHGRLVDCLSAEIQEEIKILYELNKISHTELIESINHPVIDFMANYLKNNHDIKLIEQKKEKLEKEWRRKESDFFKILSGTLQSPIYKASYTCYLSTTSNCPFYEKENWFMIDILDSLDVQIYIIAHEFMHLQFIYYYKKYCLNKGLASKQFWHVQEAIIFILNEPEFSNIITFKDSGRPIHQNFIKKLQNTWREDKDFKIFLDKIIEIVKEEFPVILD